MGPEEREAYNRIADGLEKWLIRMIAVAALIVLVSQALLHMPEFRRWASEVERGEGLPYGQREAQQWLDLYGKRGWH